MVTSHVDLAFAFAAFVAMLVALTMLFATRRTLRTAREDAERAQDLARSLRAKQAQLNAVIAALPDTLMRVDSKHRIVELKMADTHGDASPLVKIAQRPLDAMFSKSAARALGEAVDRCLEKGSVEVLEFELRLRREKRHYEARITSESESVVVVILRDVTEQTVTRAALMRAREAAEADARARTDFLAKMSHDLRNPMTGVIGMTDVLLRRESDPRRRGPLQVIQRAGGYLVSIVDDILSFSRAEQGKLVLETTPSDVEALAADVLNLATGDATPKQISLYLDVAPDVANQYVVDPLRVRQIVANLVGNAVRYTDSGHVLVRLSRLRPGVQIEVADTGVGIPDDSRDSIFDPFVQSDSAGKRGAEGAGLGLAVCKQLVTLMHGTVDVDSRVNEGSCFRVRIPATAIDSHPDPDPAVGTVLLCVANATARDAVEHAISYYGANPIQVRDLADLRSRLEADGASHVFIDDEFGASDAAKATVLLASAGERVVYVASTVSMESPSFCPDGHRTLRHPIRRLDAIDALSFESKRVAVRS